jgi:hypothetical protein
MPLAGGLRTASQIVLELRHRWRGGTTHLLFDLRPESPVRHAPRACARATCLRQRAGRLEPTLSAGPPRLAHSSRPVPFGPSSAPRQRGPSGHLRRTAGGPASHKAERFLLGGAAGRWSDRSTACARRATEQRPRWTEPRRWRCAMGIVGMLASARTRAGTVRVLSPEHLECGGSDCQRGWRAGGRRGGQPGGVCVRIQRHEARPVARRVRRSADVRRSVAS